MVEMQAMTSGMNAPRAIGAKRLQVGERGGPHVQPVRPGRAVGDDVAAQLAARGLDRARRRPPERPGSPR